LFLVLVEKSHSHFTLPFYCGDLGTKKEIFSKKIPHRTGIVNGTISINFPIKE